MQDVYKNIEEYNLGKEHKILIVFDDMIAEMISLLEAENLIFHLFLSQDHILEYEKKLD